MFSTPCYLAPRRPKYFPQHPVLKHTQPTSLLRCERFRVLVNFYSIFVDYCIFTTMILFFITFTYIVVVLERGPLSLVGSIEELLE